MTETITKWEWPNRDVQIDSVRVTESLLKKTEKDPQLRNFVYLAVIITAKDDVRAYVEVPVPEGHSVSSVFVQKCGPGKYRALDYRPPFDYSGGLFTYSDKHEPFRMSEKIESLYRKDLNFQAWLLASFRGFTGRKGPGAQICEITVPDQFSNAIGEMVRIFPVRDYWWVTGV